VKAAVFVKPGQIDVRDDVPIPEIKDGEVLVRNQVVGVCGSDHPFYQGIREGVTYPLPPGYPGHEAMGVVAESKADGVREGEWVLAAPHRGRGFAEYFVSQGARAVPLADGRHDDVFVLAQPLATVLHALRRVGPVLDLCAAVLGQGNMGLLWTEALRRAGARMVIGIDLLANRLRVAKSVGATHTVDASREDVVGRVREITNGQMADLAVEAVGFEETLNQCLDLVRPEGNVFAFGVPRAMRYSFAMRVYFAKQLTMHTTVSTQAERDFPLALDILARDASHVAAHVTHRLPFDEIQKAFELATDGSSGAIKVLLHFS